PQPAADVDRNGSHADGGPWAGFNESPASLDPGVARTAGVLLDSLVSVACELLTLLGEVAELFGRIRRDTGRVILGCRHAALSCLLGFFPCLGHNASFCLRSRNY